MFCEYNRLSRLCLVQIICSWYTGLWCVDCYIWYREDDTAWDVHPPRPLLAVPSVSASVPIIYGSLLQAFMPSRKYHKPQATFQSVLPLTLIRLRIVKIGKYLPKLCWNEKGPVFLTHSVLLYCMSLCLTLLDHPLDVNSFNHFLEHSLFSFLRISIKIIFYTYFTHIHNGLVCIFRQCLLVKSTPLLWWSPLFTPCVWWAEVFGQQRSPW